MELRLTQMQTSANNFRVTQRAMESAMPGVSLRNHTTNKQIRQRSRILDVIERKTIIKGNWAGHLEEQRYIVDKTNYGNPETTKEIEDEHRPYRQMM